MSLNWSLVLKLSLFGPAIGAVMVAGWLPQGGDRFAWAAFGVVIALTIARRETNNNPFGHGAAIGFVAGAASTFVQGLFSNALVTNNPWIVEVFAAMPEGFDLRYFILMLTPFIGIASALLYGTLAFLAAKVLINRQVSA